MNEPSIRTLAGRQTEVLSSDVLLVPARGVASHRVHVAAVSLIMVIDNVFSISEKGTSYAALLNLESAGLSNREVEDLISVLRNAGYVGKFFCLFRPRNDTTGKLRDYLLAHDISWGLILQHYEFEAFDAAELAAGFAVGVGLSFGEIVVFLRDAFDFFIDDRTSVRELLAQMRALTAQLVKLDVPALLVGEWKRLNVNPEFSAHLLELDFFRAGVALGKLGGDLYQLFSGAVALARVLGKGGRLFVRYAPLFGGEVRGAGVAAAEVVAQIGPAVLAQAQRVGALVLNLVTDVRQFARWFVSDVKAFSDGLGNLFFRLEGLTPTVAGAAPLPFRAVAWGREGMPWKVIHVFSTAAGTGGGKGAELHDAIVEVIERAWPDTKNVARAIRASKKRGVVAAAVTQLSKVTEGIVKLRDLSTLVETVRAQLIAALKDAGKLATIEAREFGVKLHTRMKDLMLAMTASLAKQGITVFAEQSVGKIAEALRVESNVLDTPLFEWIVKQPDLLKTLPQGQEAGRVVEFLGDMKYTAGTKLRDLRCDAVLVRAPEAGAEAAIIDFTSDGKLESLAKRLAEVRVKTGGVLPATATDGLLRYYASHAMFTMNIRLWVFQQAFPGWSWTSSEILYTALAKM